ncbi:MAG: 8-oxo-dGTP diphosphatase [Patescibacteria group bacterium]|jgi:mutator protein MutT|nr:8-oxo-dGTP diphosphatase [Patescibacteria group bacterium]
MNLAEHKQALKQELKVSTGLYIIQNDKVLLGKKIKGLGEGKWLGIGGKVEMGETIYQTVIRETQEEIKVTPLDFEEVAIIDFYFPLTKQFTNWNFRVHYFIGHKFQGQVSPTQEIEPQWFELQKIPLNLMWPDAAYYLPRILNGEKLKGEFLYDKDIKIIDWKLEAV